MIADATTTVSVWKQASVMKLRQKKYRKERAPESVNRVEGEYSEFPNVFFSETAIRWQLEPKSIATTELITDCIRCVCYTWVIVLKCDAIVTGMEIGQSTWKGNTLVMRFSCYRRVRGRMVQLSVTNSVMTELPSYIQLFTEWIHVYEIRLSTTRHSCLVFHPPKWHLHDVFIAIPVASSAKQRILSKRN